MVSEENRQAKCFLVTKNGCATNFAVSNNFRACEIIDNELCKIERKFFFMTIQSDILIFETIVKFALRQT